MLKRSATTLAIFATAGTLAIAQAKRPVPPEGDRVQERQRQKEPAIPPPMREPGQPINLQIELTITDQTGPGEPSRKTVTMIVADRERGSIRTSGYVMTASGRRDIVINVDARPTILKDGAIRMDFGLEYQPAGITQADASGERGQTGLNEHINVVLQSGRPQLVSQAADPRSDRRISVELKATIAK